MNLPITSQWSEFKRQHPEGAENVVTIFLQIISVIIVIVCAYYALKCKPFQSFSLCPTHAAAAQRVSVASVSERVIMRHSIHLFSKQSTFPVKISLGPASKKDAD